ncbi:dipeptidase PepE [Sciscionella marina]|uniref:dipeptidase PepE n=1 Tax=Sciscionella marina TaxID=508770 RepID=UPI000362CD57|nr:dipeptidase PepE [Sciscionella marina]
MQLLLLSNSTNHGAGRFSHAREALAEHYGGRTVSFVPYALADHDRYTELVSEGFAAAGVRVRPVHRSSDPAAELRSAEAVFIGGGNSFRLLRTMQRLGLLEAIRSAVRGGAPYGGASAGTNMACPSLRTTNDMPIVAPDGFETLGLIGFQINPHYLDPVGGSTHMGETREQRLAEFHEENDAPVLGLREGTWLRVDGESITLHGGAARLFRRGTEPAEHRDGADLSFLNGIESTFDVRD